ncbi:MAG TPA: hypothetical protein DIT48_03115 [Actinobacteria bacterium]|jgi:uncharacterized membrane protein (UPF0182 family)|nr:hypothetical protein [Actinomycetota bacterium]
MAQAGVAIRRRWIFVVLGIVVALLILLSATSGFYVDLLWFREVHFSGVFWSIYWSKLVLGLIFGFVFFVLLLTNLLIARRILPRFVMPSPEQEVIERYRAVLDPYARWAVPAFALLISVFVGIAAAARWQTFLLWRSAGGVSFGTLDPVFHRDPAFYAFILPFHKFLQGWFFSALVGVLLITAIAHYLSGNIRTQTAGEKVTPQVKAHLSVLLGLIVLVKAWGYYLGKFDLLVSPRGVVTGASYTDIHVELPALKLLVFIAVICSVLFLVNIRFRGWILPVLGLGLLGLFSIVAGGLVPAAVQRFQVAPQEQQKETPYIADNIKFTRQAFGLDKIGLTPKPVSPDITSDQITANQATISNIRLWDPSILQVNYDNLQRLQQYYEFSDVDVDRYPIPDPQTGVNQERMVMLSAREVSQAGIPKPGGTWQNQHLFYTHGYGAVASQVSTLTSEGAPSFLLSDIPPNPGAAIPLSSKKGSQVYYGERNDVPYVVVDTQQQELNYPDPNGQGLVKTSYDGRGGIGIGSFFRKLLFAYRYKDFNLLISGLIDSNSKILINRDIRTRVRKAAPFLQWDGDPYAAIVGGRLVYIWDGYTTLDNYPYSERVNLGDITSGHLSGEANYLRNSVKAVVDAYDGTVRLYVVDPSDPVIQVWRNAFPSLFQPGGAPAAMQAHFRYPEDMLFVQATEFANYHVTDPEAFYGKEKFWALPTDPTVTLSGGVNPTLRPYYVLLKLPGDTSEHFVLFMPFTPTGRNNLVSYIAAESDPGTPGTSDAYGTLKAFQFSSGQNVDGPKQVYARINQDPVFSQERTLLGSGGSNIQFGNLLIVPVEDGFLYVLPVFVASNQQNTIPELKRVIVVHGSTVTVGDNLPDAMATSFNQQPPPPNGGPPPTGSKISDLLAQALKDFSDAQTALTAGDLATYQKDIDAARALVQQANQLAAQQSGSGGSGTPTPTPSPSASPTG